MAEILGIASGVIGIASVFSTCIDVFKLFELSRSFGKDYGICRLRLTLLSARITRWGEAVDIYNNPKLIDPAASDSQVGAAAKDGLIQILKLYEESKEISNKFQGDVGRPSLLGSDAEADLAVSLSANTKIEKKVQGRRKGEGFAKVTRWLVVDRDKLDSLIKNITSLVESLESLVPPIEHRINQLAEEEMLELQGHRKEIEALLKAADGKLDTVLKEVAEAANQVPTSGHRYDRLEIDGESAENTIVHAGDSVFPDFTGNIPESSGPSHVYGNIKIMGKKGKGLRVVMGNRYGGADPFGG